MELRKKIQENVRIIKHFCPSEDILFSPMHVGGVQCMAVWCESMINPTQSWENFFKVVLSIETESIKSPNDILDMLCGEQAVVVDCQCVSTFSDLFHRIMSGGIVLLIDGSTSAASVVLPGYNFRAVSESYTEENVRASREGFAEPIKVNMTLIRRRIKSEKLVFRTAQVGSVSKTDVALVYLRDRVSPKMAETLLERLRAIDIELVLESGFIEPFLENSRHSLFSGVGYTERPDTLCGKLREGRVGILVDGTPFALIVPFLFTENFQSFDDYTNRPYYTTIIRVLKYLAFFLSILLPGTYVAVATYTPQMLPLSLLRSIASSQQQTALPLMMEALFITIVYEIVREAGLRLPRPVGHAVGLVGALVVGDAAVNAGLIGAPMVMVVALTAISSFMIPLLHEPITALRLCNILLGGLLGPFGLALSFAALLLNITSINTYGVPYMAKMSPYSPSLLWDGLIKRGWRTLAHRHENIYDLNGAVQAKEVDGGRIQDQ